MTDVPRFGFTTGLALGIAFAGTAALVFACATTTTGPSGTSDAGMTPGSDAGTEAPSVEPPPDGGGNPEITVPDSTPGGGTTSGTSPGAPGTTSEGGTSPRPGEQGAMGIPGGTGQTGTSGGRSSGGITSQMPDEVVRERRDFRTDALARLQRVEDRVRTLEKEGASREDQARIRELKSEHKSLQSQITALDRVSDDAWFQAKENVDDQLVSLERSVDDLDNRG